MIFDDNDKDEFHHMDEKKRAWKCRCGLGLDSQSKGCGFVPGLFTIVLCP